MLPFAAEDKRKNATQPPPLAVLVGVAVVGTQLLKFPPLVGPYFPDQAVEGVVDVGAQGGRRLKEGAAQLFC